MPKGGRAGEVNTQEAMVGVREEKERKKGEGEMSYRRGETETYEG